MNEEEKIPYHQMALDDVKRYINEAQTHLDLFKANSGVINIKDA